MVFGKEIKEKRQWNIVKKCVECSKDIIVKYNRGTKSYSKKNDWYEWTNNAENKGKYKCNSCLLDLYYQRPHDFIEIVAKDKRQRFWEYVNSGFIVKETD